MQESVPAYFEIEHENNQFKDSFLSCYSPLGTRILQKLMKPLKPTDDLVKALIIVSKVS